jgi:hypothetical protein
MPIYVASCADSADGNSGVAAGLGLSVETVRKWRGRFTRHGPAGLADSPRQGRSKAELVLTDAERDQLQRWARRAKTSQVLALRARIVLACAEGRENKKVAAGLTLLSCQVYQDQKNWQGAAAKCSNRDDPHRPRPTAISL